MTRSRPVIVFSLVLVALACRERTGTAPPEDAGPPPLEASRRLPDQLTSSAAPNGDGKLRAYFLDVGEGDATLLVSPTGRTVLIDAGPAAATPGLVRRLKQLLIAPVDLVVLTHAHADHAGALGNVLATVGFRRLLGPPQWRPPRPLEEDLRARGVELLAPPPVPLESAPPRVSLGGGADLWLLWPADPRPPPSPEENEAEAASIVVRATFGATSLLMTGDAPASVEEELLRSGRELQATLLKVASHGGAGATTAPFLAAVQPLASVVSAGAGNAHGHPAREVIERLEALPTRVFRTDLDGELEAVSDGSHLSVRTSRPAAGEPTGTVHTFPPLPTTPEVLPPPPGERPAAAKAPKPVATTAKARPPARVDRSAAPAGTPAAAALAPAFVASKNGDVFHRPDCRAAKRILPKNLLTFSTREEAMKERRPAADCKP